MRQFLIILIIVLLSSVPVLAGSVVNSAHNLSTEVFQFEHEVNDYNQVCIYCHTPHNATANVALWNRQLGLATTFTPYTSSTLEATPGLPSENSRMCLTCHDGTMALDAVANMGSSPVQLSTGHYALGQVCYDCHSDRPGLLTRNLSDDHPVSIKYIDSPELKPRPVEGKFANGIKLFDGKVECASCHNVHDQTISPYFLRVSNRGSALCYTCHDK